MSFAHLGDLPERGSPVLASELDRRKALTSLERKPSAKCPVRPV
jgi:hypothetical protein